MKVKTIDVDAKEWFDKINGNSYFSAVVTVNYKMKGEKFFEIPFSYGYGNAYLDAAYSILKENGILSGSDTASLWRVCDENGIILRFNKTENCLKRDLIK